MNTTEMTKQTQDEELLTGPELARRLKVSKRKIELDPNMPRIRWGSSVRYCWGDVLAYLRSQNGEETGI